MVYALPELGGQGADTTTITFPWGDSLAGGESASDVDIGVEFAVHQQRMLKLTSWRGGGGLLGDLTGDR